jgi:hypothetical protein
MLAEWLSALLRRARRQGAKNNWLARPHTSC